MLRHLVNQIIVIQQKLIGTYMFLLFYIYRQFFHILNRWASTLYHMLFAYNVWNSGIL